MALVRCDFFSDVLGLSTSMTVILPQQTAGQIGLAGAASSADHPTLYLLHGLSDDDTTWLRRTSIERYVAPLGLTVVMPQVGRSFYRDEVHGNRYWTFLSEELPRLAQEFFHVSARREDTFVAGLSMGGYGAFNWALRRPEQFAAAASLSGVVDIARTAGSRRPGPADPNLWSRVFGDRNPADTEDDLRWLLGRAKAGPTPLPDLYLCCGTEDALYEQNVDFVRTAKDRGVDLTARFGPGDHDWGYWDSQLQEVLAWLPLRRPTAPGPADS